jgi:diguanylate cyclase (GGDEF)-like protein/PAS domain S-box-containing protein
MKIYNRSKENTATDPMMEEDSCLLNSLDSSLWLESIVESSDDAIIGKNIEGRIISWNVGAERIYGYTAQEMVGQSMLILVPTDRPDEVPQILAKIKKGERVAHFETKRVRKDGIIIDISKSISPIKNKNGKIIGASTIARDITESKRIQSEIISKTEELEKTVQKLRLAERIFIAANDGILVTDIQGVIQMANPSFLVASGYKLEELLSFTPRILRSGRHDDVFYQEMWKTLIKNGQWSGEIWNKRKDGKLYPEWLSISAIYGDDGVITMYSAIYRDLSERLEYEEKIRHQASHDALTGLPNRLYFQDYLDKGLSLAKRNHKSLATFFLDIDGFKKINDTLGHDVGDLLLQAVAQRLLSVVRVSDSVTRMGGDEFTIILSEVNHKEDASVVADKVLEVIRRPFFINEHTITITTSIGISLYPNNGQDIQTLMKQADIAMYVTKNSGKNNYHFYSEID